MLKRLSIIGHFGFGENHLCGQTVKTKLITKELVSRFGDDQVLQIDTRGGKKVLLKLFIQSVSALRKTKNVVMLPAQNGIKFFTPILTIFNRIFKRKLFYIVIGGWLPQYLQNKKGLTEKLKKFDVIFVETNSMKISLENMGFKNIKVMPNCKELRILKEEELVYPKGEPYKLCTFSRVMKEKGIEEAVNAVKAVNEKLGRTVYTLDIYGQVDDKQTEWFEHLQKAFSKYIKYGGVVPFDQSVEVLKNYFALLFPTRFYTEGMPGTIIDAYSAGLPVIGAKWENYADVCVEGKTALGYDFYNKDALLQILENVLMEKEHLLEMKKECLREAQKYLMEYVMEILVSYL